jgi:hypothetical protein
MKKIIDRLAEYIEKKDISLNAFDKSLGASNGYIGKQIKNRASIGGNIIEKISCMYTDLSIEWLITGNEPMLRSDKEATTEAIAKPPGCELCAAKDAVIAAQQAQIDTQGDYIELLKEVSPQSSGQKRKAS